MAEGRQIARVRSLHRRCARPSSVKCRQGDPRQIHTRISIMAAHVDRRDGSSAHSPAARSSRVRPSRRQKSGWDPVQIRSVVEQLLRHQERTLAGRSAASSRRREGRYRQARAGTRARRSPRLAACRTRTSGRHERAWRRSQASRRLRVPTAGRRSHHHEGRTQRSPGNAIGRGPFSTGVQRLSDVFVQTLDSFLSFTAVSS